MKAPLIFSLVNGQGPVGRNVLLGALGSSGDFFLKGKKGTVRKAFVGFGQGHAMHCNNDNLTSCLCLF